MTSHAAVVARGMGKPCVSGAGSIRVDYAAQTLTVAGQALKKGDVITVDGSTGQVLLGQVKMLEPELGRIRHPHELGRQGAAHEGARQRGDAARRPHGAQFRRRGHRPVPHRAHVLRGRPHRRRARDDPGGRRGGPPPASPSSCPTSGRTSSSCSRS
jgi:pyruvate,orthophosphate dikinase